MGDIFNLKKLALKLETTEETVPEIIHDIEPNTSNAKVFSFSSTSPISQNNIPKKYLKKKKNTGYGSVERIYSFFRVITIKQFPKLVLPKRPMGKDIGHIKNLIKFVDNDLMKLKQMITMVCKDWVNAQAKWSFCTRCPSPTFYLIDTLKRDLIGCLAEGGITNGTVARHSQYAKESNYGFNEW